MKSRNLNISKYNILIRYTSVSDPCELSHVELTGYRRSINYQLQPGEEAIDDYNTLLGNNYRQGLFIIPFILNLISLFTRL